jgi:elongation factor P
MSLATDLRPGSIIKHEGIIYEIIYYHHVQRPRLAPLVRLKMKNIKLGTVTERTFSPDDKMEDVAVEERKLQFQYKQGDSFHFMDTDSYEQYEFNEKQVGEQSHYLKEEMVISMMIFEGEILGVAVPNKVDLKVAQAPPAVKGDTVSNATKTAVLETGTEVQVPLFIKEGDTVRVDTRTGEYVERVSK